MDFDLTKPDAHSLQTPWGTSISKDDEGTTITLPQLKRVVLADMSQVLSHQVNHLLGSTSHVVHFRGGGCLRFSYNDQNELMECLGNDVRLAVSHEGVVEVWGWWAAASSSSL